MAIQLSPRLAAVARHVLAGLPMADIGTDHAYLPAYLIQTGVVPNAVAGDVVPGPLQAAKETVAAAGLQNVIELRLGDGLKVLHPGEVGSATICGMGGPLIVEILEGGPLQGLRRLVLQPMGGEERLRGWLAANGWEIVAEELVEDAGRIYVIIVAEPGRMALSEQEALVGPLLSRERPALLREYLQLQAAQMERALEGAERSDRPEAQERAGNLRRRIGLLREVYNNADNRS